MRRVALRGLRARPLRAALTALAVVLGVAMISGTYIFTDTINRSFTEVFAQANTGTDVAVTSKKVDEDFSTDPPPLNDDLVAKVRAADGVKSASGAIFGDISIRKRDGDAVGSGSFVSSLQPAPFEQFQFVSGRAPRAPTEIGLDRDTFKEEGFKLGDKVKIVGEQGAQRYTLTGAAKFGDASSIAGYPVAIATLPAAQELAGKQGKLDGISVAGDDGVTPAQLRSRVQIALAGEAVNVRTGADDAKAQAADLEEEFGFLRTALLVFGGIALFVGAFVIYNTFSITVAQRTRELALLRMLGATRRQVMRSVVLEAAVIGFLASVLGLLGGLLLVPALRGLLAAIGADLPATDSVIATRTIVVSLLVGVVVTVIASVVPARRATRIAPIEALRDGLVAAAKAGRGRLIGATLLCLAGAGVARLRPLRRLVGERRGSHPGRRLRGDLPRRRAVQPAARPADGGGRGRALAAPGRRQRPPRAGELDAQPGPDGGHRGRAHDRRRARRVRVDLRGRAAGLDRSCRRPRVRGRPHGRREERLRRDAAGGHGGADPRPGVGAVSGVRFTEGKVAGKAKTTSVIGVDPATITQTYKLKWKDGSDATLSRLGADGILADVGYSKSAKIGDRVSMLTPAGKRVSYVVRGVLDEGSDFGLLGGGLVIPNVHLAKDFGARDDAFVFLRYAQAPTRGRPARRSIASWPRASRTRRPATARRSRTAGRPDQPAAVPHLRALALSLIVAFFGIVNTLALSIFERTRELGLLRAVGMSRRQVKRIVRLEAVITSLIGALLGLVLGVAFALAISRPLEEEGFKLTMPVGTLLLLAFGAAILGVLASLWPARRAARLDVLRALAYQ